MRAGCIVVTGTDLTQTSASGSFKSELDLMHAYSDWGSVYTLIRKSWAVRKLRTIIGSAWDSNPGPLALEAGALPLTALTALRLYSLTTTTARGG